MTDEQFIAAVRRTLADPEFNPPRPTGLAADESRATLVTLPDNSTALLWQHIGWGPAVAFLRKRRAATGTFEHVIIHSTTREIRQRGDVFRATVGQPGGGWTQTD